MSKFELNYRIEDSVWKDIYVSEEGQKIGTVLPQLEMSFTWRFYDDGYDAESDMMIIGEFLLFVGTDTPMSRSDIHLVFFEEEPATPGVLSSYIMWPNQSLLGFNPTHKGNFATEKPHAELKAFASQLFTFKGAIFLPSNPAKHTQYPYKESDFTDLSSKGRWIFPHPEGTRAAYEHMQKTTFEDDYNRLKEDVCMIPELKEIFQNLI